MSSSQHDLEEASSLADNRQHSSGSMHDALLEYEAQENVKNFRTLLRRVFRGGHSVDMKMKNGQTLLHHAVSLGLVKEVIKILNCGATLVENKYEKSPLDVALERGNQIVLQVLNRRADYQNYIKQKYGDPSLPNVRPVSTYSDHMGDTIFGHHKYGWSEYELDKKTNKLVHCQSYVQSIVYDNYLDWTESERSKHQQQFLEMLNKAEKKYHTDLGQYTERKKAAIERLRDLDSTLRDREHRYCMKIWSTVVGERDSRKCLEKISQKSEELKKALDISYQQVTFSGTGQMRYYNGFVMKLWKVVHIRLTGALLQLGHETQSDENRNSRDCLGGHSKTRTILNEDITRVELSKSLPLFPLVHQAFHTSRPRTEPPIKNESSKKVYFTFSFKSDHETRNKSDDTSPFLVIQRSKSHPPPKHPIVLSFDNDGSSNGPSQFLDAIRLTMAGVEIVGADVVETLGTLHNYHRHNESCHDHEFNFSGASPLSRFSESQLNSPSEWSHFGSGRTSVESLLTAHSINNSHSGRTFASNVSRSSQCSSQRQSTLSSLDESVHEDASNVESLPEFRKRPLGSVMEERESRHSNDSHSSHSRNNSSVLSGGANRIAFCSDVMVEHNRFLQHEALNLTEPLCLPERNSGHKVSSPCEEVRLSLESDACNVSESLHQNHTEKNVHERNGINSCENSSNISNESGGLDNLEMSMDLNSGAECGGVFEEVDCVRSRCASLEVTAVVSNENVLSVEDARSPRGVESTAASHLPLTPPSSPNRRPSLLSISLQQLALPSSTSASASASDDGFSSELRSRLDKHFCCSSRPAEVYHLPSRHSSCTVIDRENHCDSDLSEVCDHGGYEVSSEHSLSVGNGKPPQPKRPARHRSISSSLDDSRPIKKSSSFSLPPKASCLSNQDSRHARHSVYSSPGVDLVVPDADALSASTSVSCRSLPSLLTCLSDVRRNRDKIQEKLVQFITKRESYLELLHYLQSLRALVKRPPTTPLAKSSDPDSVLANIKKVNRKAFSLLTLTRCCEAPLNEHRKTCFEDADVEQDAFYNEHGFSADSLANKRLSSDGVNSKLPSCIFEGESSVKGSYEAEEFVNKMLDSSTSLIAEQEGMSCSLQSNDSGRNEIALNQERESNFAERRGSFYCNYEGRLPAGSPCLSSSLSEDISAYFRESTEDIRSSRDVQNTSFVSGISSLAQLGVPPEEVLDIHCIIRKDLEEVWFCESQIYQTVERLAQCLLLREQTWSQIHKSKCQEKTVETPDVDDFYEIEI